MGLLRDLNPNVNGFQSSQACRMDTTCGMVCIHHKAVNLQKPQTPDKIGQHSQCGDGVELEAPALQQDLDQHQARGLGANGAHLKDDTDHHKVELACRAQQGRVEGSRG